MPNAVVGGNQERTWLAIVISIGLLWRGVGISVFNHSPESDELAYLSMAQNLVAGNGILEGGNRAFYNAGYPLFILGPIFYFFGDSLFAARIANLILGGVSIFLCHMVAKESGAGKLGRLTAAAMWAIYLPTSIYGVYLAKENLMTPLMLGVMWCTLKFAGAPSIRLALICGALLGFLAMTGNAGLSLLGVVVLSLIIAPAPTKQRVVTLAVIGLTALVVAAPWVARNMYVVGAPVLNTNGGFNLYLGNNPSANGFFVSIADTPRGSTWHELRATRGEVQAAEVLRSEAIDWIKSHPTEFFQLSAKKALLFWTPPFHDGKGGNKSLAETVARIIWAAQFLILAAAAVAGLFLSAVQPERRRLLWLGVALYTFVHMIFYVIFRYREPIMPLVCVLAALSVETIWSQIIQRRKVTAEQ